MGYDASSAAEPKNEKPSNKVSCRTRFCNFFFKYYLPISYVFFVVFGSLVPQPGAFIDHKATNYVCVIIIFFLSGIYLRTNEMKDVFITYKGAIYGMIAILGITPVIGGQLTSLLDFSSTVTNQSYINQSSSINTTLGHETPLYIPSPIGSLDFKFGLILFFCMPCTVSSGVVMVTQLNGHVALAIFLTVVTNIVGIFTVPLYIKWMIASTINVKLDLTSLMLRLLLTLFLPLVVGKMARCIKRAREFATPKKKISKIVSTTFLDIIVWAKVSSTSLSGLMNALTVTNVFFIIGWTLAIHILYLLLNTLLSYVLKLPLTQKKAVILLCSQKTLAVAIPVVTFLPKAIGDKGMMVIAMIVAQITMIVFDSILVSVWMSIEERRIKKNRQEEEDVAELETFN